MNFKLVEHFQDVFTSYRVEFLEKLTDAVKNQTIGPREAVDVFAGICKWSPVEARKYMYLMTNSETRHIWNFKV